MLNHHQKQYMYKDARDDLGGGNFRYDTCPHGIIPVCHRPYQGTGALLVLLILAAYCELTIVSNTARLHSGEILLFQIFRYFQTVTCNVQHAGLLH